MGDVFFHGSPVEGLDEEGLEGSRVQYFHRTPFYKGDCSGDDVQIDRGVYLTDSVEGARRWCSVIGAESNEDEFYIYKVELPGDVEVVSDPQPINERAMPSSKIACINQINDKFIELEEKLKIDIGGVDYG